MIVKDHILTGESFEIKKVSKGVLTTLPKSNTHDLRRYYYSKNYYSHSSSKSVLSILYDLSSRFMVFRKIKLVSRLLKDKKKLLDFGCGRGGFLLSAKKRGFEVCGVELIPSVQKELIETLKDMGPTLENGREIMATFQNYFGSDNMKNMNSKLKF